MLNRYKETWVFIQSSAHFPEFNKSLCILIEPDVIYDTQEDYPIVRKATLIQEKTANYTISLWKLLDYDPETEEEILQQNKTVIAWRYNPTHHDVEYI